MPTHKGISISIISQNELRPYPEFPHPDTSQFTFRSPVPEQDGTKKKVLEVEFPFKGLSPVAITTESKADKLLGRQTAVSVYIPSLSGARFWVRYNVSPATASDVEFMYFKLHFNGNKVASWGIDPKKEPVGQVMRGLFQPNECWDEIDGATVIKSQGIEIQRFRFAKEEDIPPALIEGGLIEILVYQADRMLRKLVKPEMFKEQSEDHGIVFYSGGILPDPQDAKNYQFHLKDSKDKPFASFKFHYRSWSSLVAQQLVPDDYPCDFLEPCPDLISFGPQSPESVMSFSELVEAYGKDEDITSSPGRGVIARDSSSSFENDSPWISDVFVDKHFDLNTEKAAKPKTTTAYRLPPQVAPLKPRLRLTAGPLRARAVSQQKQQQRDTGFLQRPLPEIPREDYASSRSRASSRASITPSLLSYFDRDNDSPEPTIAFATAVPFMMTKSRRLRARVQQIPRPDPGPLVESSINVVQIAPPSGSGHIASQLKSGLSAKAKASLANVHPLTAHPISRPGSVKKTYDIENEASKSLTSINISESEWMRKTPSPEKRKAEEKTLLGRFWSPAKNSMKSNAKLVTITKSKSANNSPGRSENKAPMKQTEVIEDELQPTERDGLLGDVEDDKHCSTATADSRTALMRNWI